jgi:hypothetical protein
LLKKTGSFSSQKNRLQNWFFDLKWHSYYPDLLPQHGGEALNG